MYIDIILGLLVLTSFVVCFARGFLVTLLTVGKYVLSVFITFAFFPELKDWLASLPVVGEYTKLQLLAVFVFTFFITSILFSKLADLLRGSALNTNFFFQFLGGIIGAFAFLFFLTFLNYFTVSYGYKFLDLLPNYEASYSYQVVNYVQALMPSLFESIKTSLEAKVATGVE